MAGHLVLYGINGIGLGTGQIQEQDLSFGQCWRYSQYLVFFTKPRPCHSGMSVHMPCWHCDADDVTSLNLRPHATSTWSSNYYTQSRCVSSLSRKYLYKLCNLYICHTISTPDSTHPHLTNSHHSNVHSCYIAYTPCLRELKPSNRHGLIELRTCCGPCRSTTYNIHRWSL